MVKKPLIRPAISGGGTLGEGRLTSHDSSSGDVDGFRGESPHAPKGDASEVMKSMGGWLHGDLEFGPSHGPKKPVKKITLTQPSWTLSPKKFERLIFPTKCVIPKSLKFSHWLSENLKQTNPGTGWFMTGSENVIVYYHPQV